MQYNNYKSMEYFSELEVNLVFINVSTGLPSQEYLDMLRCKI